MCGYFPRKVKYLKAFTLKAAKEVFACITRTIALFILSSVILSLHHPTPRIQFIFDSFVDSYQEAVLTQPALDLNK